MSTLIILLDQNFNANYIEMIVFEPSVLFHPPPQFGGIDDMVRHMEWDDHGIIVKNVTVFDSISPDAVGK